jgi:hypothetical protein
VTVRERFLAFFIAVQSQKRSFIIWIEEFETAIGPCLQVNAPRDLVEFVEAITGIVGGRQLCHDPKVPLPLVKRLATSALAERSSLALLSTVRSGCGLFGQRLWHGHPRQQLRPHRGVVDKPSHDGGGLHDIALLYAVVEIHV